VSKVIFSFLLPALGYVQAQVFANGAFLGRVQDPTGAAVPNASVRIFREGTQLQRQTTTDAEGNYQLLDIPIGNYRFEFEKEGFRKVMRTGVSLSAGQSLRIDARLDLGSVAETVTVDATAVQVDTTTANLGNTVFGAQVSELALATRSFSTLVILEPGVLSNETQQPGVGDGLSFSFNGGNQSSNNWLLDGGHNQDTYAGNNQTMVNLDAIAEVHIERNPYSAEFGRNMGAQINVITRSGSNSFHGTLFEFFRNDHLDARNFFATSKPHNRYNNFGGTVGGPIKKDKLFFFLSNEYRRIRSGTTQTTIVPTAAMLAGNFNGVRTIKDPLTGQPFPNNTIPAARMDPNALLLLNTYYPAPNFLRGALNFSSSEPDSTNFRSGLGRLDYNITPNLTFAGHYNIDSSRLYYAFGASNIPTVSARLLPAIFYTGSGTLTWTVKPTLLNTFTMATYHGSKGNSVSSLASRDRAPSLSVPRYFNTVTDSSAFIPSIIPSQGYASIQIVNQQAISHYSFEINDQVSYTVGSHTIQFGGALDRETKTQNNSNPNNNGTFAFNGSATGDSMADMLLGAAYQYTESSTHLIGKSEYNDPSLFVQDRYRIHPRLTLTLGLRWEYFQPERDYAGTMAFFDPASFNFSKAAVVQSNGQIVPGTQGDFLNGIVQVGKDAKYGYALTNSVHNTFDPRFGFAYSLTKDGKTALRGGYGIFHDRWVIYASQARTNPPLNQSISIYNTNFSNPTSGQLQILPVTLTNFTSPWNVPYLQKWSLNIQRQLPGEFLLDVGYVGSRGIHLIRSVDMNQPIASVPVASGMISANAVRPYPGFAAINAYTTDANSLYHSLQVSLVKRFGHGLSIQSAYTYSKSLDDVVTPPNSYAASRPNWGLSTFDRTHVWISSFVWDLPFGENSTGFRRHLLNGWEVSGITSFQSGNPLTITIPSDRAGTGSTGQRPDVVGQMERLMTLSQWFTTNIFALPALGTFGNAGRSLVRAPGINNWDAAFIKKFQLRESVSLQFRGEFFNLFNHSQFSGVGTSFGSGTFGQVTSARNARVSQLALRLTF
jgi:hypothetical protein